MGLAHPEAAHPERVSEGGEESKRISEGGEESTRERSPGRPLALSEDIKRPGDRELTSKLSIISSLTC